MLFKDTGVEESSYRFLFDPPENLKKHMYYMTDCGRFMINSSYSRPSSSLDTPLFFFITKGSLDMYYDGRSFEVKTDEIALLEGGKSFSASCRDSCDIVFFHFGGPFAGDMVKYLIGENGSPVFKAKAISGRFYWSVRNGIMDICASEHASEANRSALVYSSLCMLKGFDDQPSTPGFSSKAVISRTIRYIQNHIDEKITLASLAKEANLSPAYLSKLFKKETGFSPIEYVSNAKINHAKHMLSTTNSSVTEISYFLSFASPSSFINAFKARTGVSPTQYREDISHFAPPRIIKIDIYIKLPQADACGSFFKYLVLACKDSSYFQALYWLWNSVSTF